MLSQKNIKSEKIIENDDNNNYNGPSYSLRIDKIYQLDENGDGISKFRLEPRGQILIITKEEFNLPKDVVGYTTVKNSLSLEGIYALNIGIVDPSYKGPISTILINFGNKTKLIKENDEVLRMTFHRFEVSDDDHEFSLRKYTSRDSYTADRKNAAGNALGATFLSIMEVKAEINNYVRDGLKKSIGLLALIIASLSIISICITLTIHSINSNKSKVFYKLEEKNRNEVTLIVDSLSNNLTKRIEYLESIHIKK